MNSFKQLSSKLVVRSGALLGAGSLAYLAHHEIEQDDTRKNNHFEGLTRTTSLPSFVRPSVAMCDSATNATPKKPMIRVRSFLSSGALQKLERKETVREQRDREMATVREMLLENPNLQPKKFKKGHIVHKEGEVSKALCIVLDGEISLSTGRLSVSRKHKGDIFGALPLVVDKYGARRFTARCISSECTIVEVGQEDFDKAIAAHPELKKGLRDICLCQEFQRLVVMHTQKHFPKTIDGIRSLFYSIKYNPGSELNVTDVERVVRSMSRNKSHEEIEMIFSAMDVDGNGGLSVDEFEALFYAI